MPESQAGAVAAPDEQLVELAREGDRLALEELFGGRIYFLNEDGETTVIASGKQLQKLATNRLDGATLASIAVSRGALFIRTQEHLYRLERAT